MKVFDAIKQMREISQKGGEFTVTFMTYSTEKRKSHGPRSISRARLTKQSSAEKVENADIMLNMIDLDRAQYLHVYQPLLMVFNGHKLNL